jgi:ABC-2 type transport system ATP-binding protein
VDRPLIDIQGLAKRYGDFTAIADLDLAVGAGELFALLGPNGAGKTTTIRMLMGILRPSAGSARIAGHDCFSERVEVMRRIGYLPDEPVFYDYLRGREIVRFVGEMHGLARAEIARRADPLLARLELADAGEEFAVNYSKGMKKKLALLCALLPEPEVLILDEPTNGLDPYATRALHELMREQVAGGRTIFFSTHLLDQAEKLSHRVGIVFKGRLVAVGTPSELRARVAATGAPAATLEDVFFALTGDRGEPAPA